MLSMQTIRLLWRRALEAEPDVPSPEGHGWTVNNNEIHIDWMSLPPTPEALLQLIICGCTGQCTGGACTCFCNNMVCTDSCQCGDNFQNPASQDGDTDETDDTGPTCSSPYFSKQGNIHRMLGSP